MTTWGFIGTGNMAGAIVRGAVDSGYVAGADVVLYNPTQTKAEALASATGARVVGSTQELVATADVVVLGFKPATFPDALPGLAPTLAEHRPVVVSIAAGLTLHRIASLLGTASNGLPLLRVMPNVNSLIGAGMAAVAATSNTSEDQRAQVLGLFQSVGDAVELDEKHFSAFTAAAGSSPAFAYLFIDSIARGALEAGLPKAVATRVAAQAVAGSAQMVLESGEHPWALVDKVSSPGGTTVSGFLALEDNAFVSAVVAAVRATVARDKELGAGA